MDKTEKLALARKKLRKFQAKNSPSSSLTDSHREVNGVLDTTPIITKTENAMFLSPEVHSQSIDALVSEKTSLMHRLSMMETDLRQKQQECLAHEDNVNSLRKKLDQSTADLEMKNKSSMNDRQLRTDLRTTKNALEELREENTELTSRLMAQSRELNEQSKARADLQNKLSMQEILIQQLQTTPTQTTTPINDKGTGKIEELESEISVLMASLQSGRRERDQAVSDVAALREAMLNSQQENARKVGELQTSLQEAEIENHTLAQHLTAHSNSSGLKDREVSSLHESLDAVSRERNDLKTRLQQLVSDNARLSQLYTSSEDSITRLEGELARARGELVDQQSLITSISQDKESISRAVAQNKDLKEQLAELQEAFVHKSQQNMELATALESQKYQNQQLIQAQGKLREDLTEEKRVEEMGDKREEYVRAEPEGVAHPLPQDNPDQSQIQELSMECVSLREERDKLLEELRHLTSPSPPSSALMDQSEDNSFGSGSLLQQSFSALQERFTYVMKDKADLLDRLQVMEHTIIQLSGENETIAEYITLYQTQREALKLKFNEKDQAIEQLQQEKNNLQLKLREVQLMVSRIDHTPSLNDPPQHPNNLHPSPPAHLALPRRGVVNEIVSLIEEELSYPTSSTTAQCPCCSGQLIVI